jgi:hypothetical protein
MAQAHTYYDFDHHKRLTQWFIRERIGHGLRERYNVPKDLPRKLLTLVRKLDDSDWLFPSASWHDDVDLFGG